MPAKYRLKDIAEALNLSITTVSRALNDKPDISDATKKAVLELAQLMDYHPNAFAVSLRRSESKVVGVILPKLDHYIFSRVLKGIVHRAHESGYMVILGETQHQTFKERELISQFAGFNVAGILLSPCRDEIHADHLNELRSKNVPVVLIDRSLRNYSGYFVHINDYDGAIMATEHLIQQGYERIAHLRGTENSSVATDRYRGYCDALRKHGREIDPNLVKDGKSVNQEEGYYMAKQLLYSSNPPDAFFTVTDDVALGVYKVARELGLRIPEDLGVVGYSNSKVSSHVTPTLSTVDQPGFKMGETAFEFFLDGLQRNTPEKQKIFAANLIIRESSIRKKATD